jgi:hypothetical protein
MPEIGKIITSIPPVYRRRERVRFVELPPEVKALRGKRAEYVTNLRDGAKLNEFLLDAHLLREHRRGRPAAYFNPLNPGQPGTEEAAVSAVEWLQIWLHSYLNNNGMIYPLSAIRRDPRISPETKVVCYTFLWRGYCADEIYEEKCIRSQGGIYREEVDMFLKTTHALIEKYYILTRYFPGLIEEEDIPLPFHFSSGISRISTAFSRKAQRSGFNLPSYVRALRFKPHPSMDIPLATLHRKFPIALFMQVIDEHLSRLRNIVLV